MISHDLAVVAAAAERDEWFARGAKKERNLIAAMITKKICFDWPKNCDHQACWQMSELLKEIRNQKGETNVVC
jgi:hypothetical protein